VTNTKKGYDDEITDSLQINLMLVCVQRNSMLMQWVLEL